MKIIPKLVGELISSVEKEDNTGIIKLLYTVESHHYAPPPFATIALAKTVGGGAYLRDPANYLAITPHPLQESMLLVTSCPDRRQQHIYYLPFQCHWPADTFSRNGTAAVGWYDHCMYKDCPKLKAKAWLFTVSNNIFASKQSS